MRFFYSFWIWFTKPKELVAWLGSDMEHVSADEAKSRLSICKNCPCNVPGTQIAKISAEILKRMAVMKGRMGMEIPGETDNFCSGCGCLLKAKIWVKYDFIKSYQRTDELERMRAANSRCWQI